MDRGWSNSCGSNQGHRRHWRGSTHRQTISANCHMGLCREQGDLFVALFQITTLSDNFTWCGYFFVSDELYSQ